MIFAPEHIEMIKSGRKTQTRRESGRYQVGKDYSIQPCRTCPGIPDGRILILSKKQEAVIDYISEVDAFAEGGYTPKQYEALYQTMHPEWRYRWAYTLKFVPNRSYSVH